jgi:predicted transport protein
MSYEKFKYTEALDATMLMEAINNMPLEEKTEFLSTVFNSGVETNENFRVIINTQMQINLEIMTLLKQAREENECLRSMLH